MWEQIHKPEKIKPVLSCNSTALSVQCQCIIQSLGKGYFSFAATFGLGVREIERGFMYQKEALSRSRDFKYSYLFLCVLNSCMNHRFTLIY